MPYTPLPPPPQRNDPENFADDGDAFLGALPQFGVDMEAVRLTAIDAIAAAPIAIAAANYKGEYSAVVTYQVGQSVSYGGARWIAKTVNLAITPTDGANWGVIREIPDPVGNSGKVLKSTGPGVSWQPLLPVVYRVAQYTASATFTVPSDTYVIRPYAFGKGGNGSASASGGGGGCAYGDIAVTPGQSVTLSIAAGVAKVTIGGVDMLTANPASGVTAGTASKHVSVTNGGAYSGGTGAGVAKGSGASSGSPLGNGFNGGSTITGGAGWGGQGGAGGGGGVGGPPATAKRGGDGLALPSTDPILFGLNGLGAGSDNPGQPGGGGGLVNLRRSDGGFGGGGGYSASSDPAGDGGFGGGGGGNNSSGAPGNGGIGGGGGGGSAIALGGPAVIRIYY